MTGAFAADGPPIRSVFAYQFELPPGTAIPAATLVPAREAPSVPALLARIASLAEAPAAEVLLRDAAAARDPRPRVEPAGHRVRLCDTSGALLAEAVIPEGGGVLLVPLRDGATSAVLAFRERLFGPERIDELEAHEAALSAEAAQHAVGSRLPHALAARVVPCR